MLVRKRFFFKIITRFSNIFTENVPYVLALNALSIRVLASAVLYVFREKLKKLVRSPVQQLLDYIAVTIEHENRGVPRHFVWGALYKHLPTMTKIKRSQKAH